VDKWNSLPFKSYMYISASISSFKGGVINFFMNINWLTYRKFNQNKRDQIIIIHVQSNILDVKILLWSKIKHCNVNDYNLGKEKRKKKKKKKNQINDHGFCDLIHIKKLKFPFW